MMHSNVTAYTRTIVILKTEGRLALALDALAAAQKTRNEQRRKYLCGKAMGYLKLGC